MKTTLRYLNVLLENLEEYSKDKIIYIKTHKMRKGKSAGFEKSYDDEDEDALNYQDEDAEQYAYAEKRFNYIASMSEFVTYSVVRKLVNLLKNPSALDDELITALTVILKRITSQVKATWIFYQLDTMVTFHDFLMEHRKDLRYSSIVSVISQILKAFFAR